MPVPGRAPHNRNAEHGTTLWGGGEVAGANYPCSLELIFTVRQVYCGVYSSRNCRTFLLTVENVTVAVRGLVLRLAHHIDNSVGSSMPYMSSKRQADLSR